MCLEILQIKLLTHIIELNPHGKQGYSSNKYKKARQVLSTERHRAKKHLSTFSTTVLAL